MLVDQIRSNSRLYFRLAYGVLRDAEAAEDACQQTFLKAWTQRHGFRDQAALRSWLAKVVVNESLQTVRRRESERRAHGVLERSARTSFAAEQADDIGHLLREALTELPEETRLVVVLRIVQGMAGHEVTTLLGCSAATVSRRLHEGMKQLRRILKDARAIA